MSTDLASLAAFALVALVGYLVGSISFGYIVAKSVKNVDLRRVGSVSTCGTNAFRALGRGPGKPAAVAVNLIGILPLSFLRLLLMLGFDRRLDPHLITP